MKDFLSFLAMYFPKANPADGFVAFGYTISQNLVQVLRSAETTSPGDYSLRVLKACRLHHGAVANVWF